MPANAPPLTGVQITDLVALRMVFLAVSNHTGTQQANYVAAIGLSSIDSAVLIADLQPFSTAYSLLPLDATFAANRTALVTAFQNQLISDLTPSGYQAFIGFVRQEKVRMH